MEGESSPSPAVVLVRPREEGNVGAAARAMANMGLDRLVLVEPAAALGNVAQAFAVGARDILEASRRAPDLHAALAPFRRIVATTSTRDRLPDRRLVAPRQLAALLGADPPGTPTALVFGPEVGGLTNDELALASLLVTVPCAPRQPTLNLSQAVLIVAYELHFDSLGDHPGPERPAIGGLEPPATEAEMDGLFGHLESVLGRIGFDRDTTFAQVVRDLRRLAARAELDSREVRVLRGIFRRGERALERRRDSD
jgi:tRNA (cytidine32/uridine32-2'-O)-methyltransferase